MTPMGMTKIVIRITRAAVPMIMVGPVAIVPERQGQGFGRALMAAQAEAIEDARMQGAPALPQVLIGDAPYYGKFGFAEAPRGWTCPGPWDPARLLVRGVKMYADGALGSRGAWLKKPYADDPGNTGLPLMNQAQFRNTLVRAGLGNFQVAAHAIGDAANAEVLNAVAEVGESFKGDRRWRIEHAQVVDPADLARFGKHGIIASMQPVHQTSDRLMAEARLGPARLAGAYAWRSIADTGARLAFGSDAPVELPDVFAGLATAFTRTDAAGEPFGGWRPEQRVTREEALAAYTAGAAYAGFAEGRFGKLAAGERADFVLVDRDPLLATPAELRAAKVLETWVGGMRVFAAP